MKKIFSLSYKLGKKILLLKNSNAFKMFSITISVLLIILLRCVTNQLANQIISILFYIVIVLLEIILLSDKVLLSVKGFLEMVRIYQKICSDDIEQENIIDMFFNRFIHRK